MKASLAAAGLLGRTRIPSRPVWISSPGISGCQRGRMSPGLGALMWLGDQPPPWRVMRWGSKQAASEALAGAEHRSCGVRKTLGEFYKERKKEIGSGPANPRFG